MNSVVTSTLTNTFNDPVITANHGLGNFSNGRGLTYLNVIRQRLGRWT